MKRGLVAVSLMMFAVMSACGVESASEDSDDSEPVAEAQGELLSCGGLCPAGYEPSGFGCSTACAGTCPNAVNCVFVPMTASISASPTSVPVAAGAAANTRICWDTRGLTAPVWIRVRVNGAPGQLFTKESDNGHACEDAPWIQAGNSYVFRVHTANSDGAPVLAGVTVNGVLQSGGSGGAGGGAGVCDGLSGVCPAGKDCHCADVCRPIHSICP